MSEKLYNLDMVKEMAGGSQEFVNQLIQLFLDSVPESMELINTHYNNGDFEAMGKEAHKLKSTIRTIEVPSMVNQVMAIERIGKTGENLASLPGLLQEFNEVMPKVVDQMKEEL
jgi:HPt (histidine-containing phosphotransfer) domain-containing protein